MAAIRLSHPFLSQPTFLSRTLPTIFMFANGWLRIKLYIRRVYFNFKGKSYVNTECSLLLSQVVELPYSVFSQGKSGFLKVEFNFLIFNFINL